MVGVKIINWKTQEQGSIQNLPRCSLPIQNLVDAEYFDWGSVEAMIEIKLSRFLFSSICLLRALCLGFYALIQEGVLRQVLSVSLI